MTTRLAPGVFLGVAAFATLVACGTSTSSNDPQVASLPSGNSSASTGTTASASAAIGIQERLDDTPQRQNEILQAYENCLHDHGAPGVWLPQLRSWKVSFEDSSQVTAAELQSCASKKPIPAPELDPTKNPRYAQDVQADAQCARDHGISITIGADGWWMPTDPNQSGIDTVARQCLIQAFGNS
jgi:hypothetical protein